jgi:hypothetical protein
LSATHMRWPTSDCSFLRSEHRNRFLFAQQEQTKDREQNADDSLPRWLFAKEKNPRDGHDRRAASQNCRNRRKRSALLKKEKKRDRASADANTGKHRVTNAGNAEFLTPSSPKPKNRQIDQDRQCGARFDNETAETFANALGRKTCKNLMSAVKNSGKHCIPEPSCHETNLGHEMDHPREN